MSIQWKSLLLTAIFLPLTLNASLVDEFRTLHLQNADKEDFLKLEKEIEKELPSEKSLLHFAFGKKMLDLKDYEKADYHLSESLRLGTSLDQIASLVLAKSYVKNGKAEAAKIELTKVIKQRSYLKEQAQFDIANILLEQGNKSNARRVYRYLVRHMRSDVVYPDILWNLAKIDISSKKPSNACWWIKKLYSDQPQYDKIASWKLDPASIEVDSKKTSCFISTLYKKKRIRNLILSGNSERAKLEVDDYVEKYKKDNAYESDFITAYYLVQDGFPHEAFKTLVPYYSSYKGNSEYLLQLAKASVRSGEFQTAVGAYYKAHELRKKERSGRLALYHAGFLSYQFQDYDGASRKFKEYIEQYPWSGLTKNAKWHLAWLKYLKRDYKGALAAFKDLKRYRRFARKDQTLYWKAMSHLNLEQKDEAEKIFKQLINEKNPTYYGVAAASRMNEMGISLPRTLANISEIVDISGEDENILNEDEESEEFLANIDEVAEKEEQTRQEKMSGHDQGEDVAASEEDITKIENVSVLKAKGSKKKEAKAQLKAKKIFSTSTANQAYQRAQDLIRLGFYDYARWELFQVEKYSRNNEERKKLIPIYEKIEAYHRSLHIATNRFIKERYRLGIKGANGLWQGAYPKAFEDKVMRNAKTNQVDPYFIWSIMRAESHFRKDAASPVGAQGLMQLMPYTATRIAKASNIKSPEFEDLKLADVNIKLGSAYLGRLLKQFNQQLPLAAAGYNAGPHRVKSWIHNFGTLNYDEFIEHIPFVETRKYVKKVIRYHYIYRQIYDQPKIKDYAWLTSKIPYEYQGKVPTKEVW